MTFFSQSVGYNYLPEIPLDTVAKADDLLAKELTNLSFQDRNAIDEEIHGVHNVCPGETPELLETSMSELSTELSNIEDKPAFDKSQRLFPDDTYVNAVDFRLRFLRCELFDAEKAAARIVAFLEILDELFDGDLILRRPPKITDLSKAEMKVLRSGIHQILPYRDRSGRPIIMTLGDMGFHVDLRIRMRVRLYLLYVGSNDAESQRKGFVAVGWPEGDFTNTPMPLRLESRRLLRLSLAGMPIRQAAIHICMPDTMYFHLLRAFMTTLFKRQRRARLRFHVVTGIERRYKLQGYGIPVEMIPVTDSGNIKLKYLYQWIKVRKFIESKENKESAEGESIILLPGSNDVLIRAGTTTLCHPGNVFFRGLIEKKHYEFKAGSESTQALLAEDVVEEIERLKGRFLAYRSQGFWTELRDRKQIIFKVEVSIRDFKTKVRARKNLQISCSSTNEFGIQDGKRAKLSNVIGESQDGITNEKCACAC